MLILKMKFKKLFNERDIKDSRLKSKYLVIFSPIYQIKSMRKICFSYKQVSELNYIREDINR